MQLCAVIQTLLKDVHHNVHYLLLLLLCCCSNRHAADSSTMSLQVKAGVEARVKAALSQATQLQTDMEELREEHALELSSTQQQIAAVQQDLADQHEHSQDLSKQLSDACQTVTRCGAQLHLYKQSLHGTLESCVVANVLMKHTLTQ